MKVHDSARKHGVLPEDSIRVASWPIWIEDLDDESPARQLRPSWVTGSVRDVERAGVGSRHRIAGDAKHEGVQMSVRCVTVASTRPSLTTRRLHAAVAT